MTPDGIIQAMYGPFLGSCHDAGAFKESKLDDELRALPLFTNGDQPALYGDSAYGLRHPSLLRPFRNAVGPQKKVNVQMAKARILVEWGFGIVINTWAFVDFKKNLKLLKQPIARYYQTAVLLTNALACLRGNEISLKTKLAPPTLSQYFSL